MFKSNSLSILKLNRFEFGDQVVSQFIVFECKWLFSIIFFYFHKSQSSQDRFHTHAFNAISVKLFGEYTEYILDDEETGEYHKDRRIQLLRWFPKESYHKIGNSNGCLTLLLSGPWGKTWKEYVNGEIIEYSWNRKKLI